jgi:predicted alpha-1,6-mannanase (GH76 family)
MYLQAASETAEFVRAHLCNVAKLVQDTISARANDSCAVNEVVGPYNSGLMIHGLGILADITSNATTRDL